METFVHGVEIHNSKAPRQAIASLDVGAIPLHAVHPEARERDHCTGKIL